MSNHEDNPNMDLNFQNIELLISNLESLQKNLIKILKLKQNNSDITNSITTIEQLLSLIRPLKNKKDKKNSKDLDTSKENLKIIKEKLEKYFNSNEEIKNLVEIIRLINKSKDVLETFDFNPPQENFQENNNNSDLFLANSFSSEENPFLINDVSEGKIQSLENNFSYIKSDNKINVEINNFNNNNYSSSSDARKTFIENFLTAINIIISRFDIIASSIENKNFPIPGDEMKNFQYVQYLDWIMNLNSNFEYPSDYNYNDQNMGTMEQVLNNLKDKYIKIQETEDGFVEEGWVEENEEKEDKVPANFNFREINKKLFYFINIISKDNINFNKEYIKNIAKNISKNLEINNSDLFLIQNSSVDNFVKSFNFKEMNINQNLKIQSLSKLNELKSIKFEFIMKELNTNEIYLDNKGNFLYPNSRRIKFRGKEIYDPPYGWMGLGLNVSGKYGNDKWLEDISKDSEWAVAYRGIASKNMKKILEYFIKNRNLKSSEVNLKKGLNDSRHWKIIKSGVYMTPFIKIAEKYTQSISFNNKNYKVLLMTKVKISEIQQPKNSPFWLLNSEHIRIYRVLFKEIN